MTGVYMACTTISIFALLAIAILLVRQMRRRTDEITELQASVDLIMIQHGQRPFFSPRYDIDIVPIDEEDE